MAPRIFNFGSCCIDHVYAVPHFVQPGETLPATNYSVHPGGKGLNQSIAAAKAGASILHAGRIGPEGEWLKSLLNANQVDTTHLLVDETPTGHAIIQVVPEGENAIVIYGGANRCITSTDINNLFARLRPDDILLLQNEINLLPEILSAASQLGVATIFNAAPMTEEVLTYPLHTVHTFILNEGEAQALTGAAKTDEILDTMKSLYPDAALVLTLGREGAIYQLGETKVVQSGFEVEAVDTTGAGDTFTGYYVAGLLREDNIQNRLQTACRAAAMSVTRNGAASSIPDRSELS